MFNIVWYIFPFPKLVLQSGKIMLTAVEDRIKLYDRRMLETAPCEINYVLSQ